jgi:hypothetical protein
MESIIAKHDWYDKELDGMCLGCSYQFDVLRYKGQTV